MKRLHLLAAVFVLGAAGTSVAQAMPAAPAGLRQASPVIEADWACGRGFHMTPRGVCRPNWAQPRWDWRRPPRPAFEEGYGYRYRRPEPRFEEDYSYRRPRPRFYEGY